MEKCSSTEREQVSASVQTMMRDYAAIEWPELNHKGRMAQLARTLGFGHRRTRALYQNEWGVRVRADEMAALEQLTREARHEYRDLAQLAASLQALLYGPEADFYRPQVDAIRAGLLPQGQGFAGGGRNDGTGSAERSAATFPATTRHSEG